jgi:hypothetical protein
MRKGKMKKRQKSEAETIKNARKTCQRGFARGKRAVTWVAGFEGRSYKVPAATDGCGFVSGSYHKP